MVHKVCRSSVGTLERTGILEIWGTKMGRPDFAGSMVTDSIPNSLPSDFPGMGPVCFCVTVLLKSGHAWRVDWIAMCVCGIEVKLLNTLNNEGKVCSTERFQQWVIVLTLS